VVYVNFDIQGANLLRSLDDVDHMNFPKLDQQIETALALTRGLLVTATPPVLVTDAPLRSQETAEQSTLVAVVVVGVWSGAWLDRGAGFGV
jgi:hypothetical protein